MACLAALGFGLAMPGFGLSGRPLSSTAAMGLHLVAIAAATMSLSPGRRATRRVQPEVEVRYDVRAWMRGSLPLWAGAGLTACGETQAAFGRRSIPAEPRRFAPLIVAFRSKYTRYSSLTRLVSRAPRRPRRSRGFHHRLLRLLSSSLDVILLGVFAGMIFRRQRRDSAPAVHPAISHALPSSSHTGRVARLQVRRSGRTPGPLWRA